MSSRIAVLANRVLVLAAALAALASCGPGESEAPTDSGARTGTVAPGRADRPAAEPPRTGTTAGVPQPPAREVVRVVVRERVAGNDGKTGAGGDERAGAGAAPVADPRDDAAPRPLAGAAVELRRRDDDGRVVVLARAVCDASGAGELVLPGGAARSEAPSRAAEHTVRASAPGHVAVTRSVAGPGPHVFELAPGVPVEGRVLAAEDAAPIGGALVRVNPAAREAPHDFVVTAADGSFRFDGVPPGRASLAAFPAGRASVEVEIDLRADGADHDADDDGRRADAVRKDLYVPAGTALTGVVRFRGKPVAGAVVRDTEAHVSVTTGADGAYRLAGLAPGRRLVVVEAPGLEPLDEQAEMPSGLATLRFDIDLVPAWIVRGRVVAGERPVAGARVARFRQDFDDPDALVVTTGSDGAFEMRGAWPPPAALVALAAEGWAGPVTTPDFAEPVAPATSTAADGVVLDVEPGAPTDVVVVDETGRPVAGAEVVAGPGILVRRSDEFPEERGITDERGECVVTLARGDWRVTARRDGFFAQTVEREITDGGPGRVTVRIVMRAGGDVSGRVVDPGGAPVPGVELWAWGDQMEWKTTTDAAGRWSLRGVPDDDVRVRIARDGWVWSSGHYVNPTKPPQDLVMNPESVIEGVVTLPDGATPARAFTVRLFFMADEAGEPWRSPWWPFRTETVCDANGRFVLHGVTPGTIDVEAAAGAFVSPKRERVVLGQDARRATVAIRLAPGARISGRVVDGSGNVQAGVFVEGGLFTWDDDSHTHDYETWTDADGRWEFGGLPPGRYLVNVGGISRIAGADLDDVEAKILVTLAAGESVVRDVTLHRPGFLDVRVVDESGEEIEDDVDWSLTDAAGAEADGYGPLQPGTYTVHASCEGYRDATLAVRVEAGKRATVTVTLRR